MICSDKTGTLTKNEMTVTSIVTSDGWRAHVTGSGYSNQGEVVVLSDPPVHLGNSTNWSSPPSEAAARSSVYNVLEVGCVCNNASISSDGVLRGQPTEGALLAAAMKYGMHACSLNYQRLQEFPFNSVMTNVNKLRTGFFPNASLLPL